MHSFRCYAQARIATKHVDRVALKVGVSYYRYGSIQVQMNSNHHGRFKANTTKPSTHTDTRQFSAFTNNNGKQLSSISIKQHLQEMLTNSGYNLLDNGIDEIVKKSVDRILTPENNNYVQDDATKKIRNEITTFQKNYGSKNFAGIAELSLKLALVQSQSNILGPSLHGAIEAYSLDYSPPDISQVIADWDDFDQKIETNGTNY